MLAPPVAIHTLPLWRNTVKAYRFKKESVTAGNARGKTTTTTKWVFKGAEFIKDEVAYKMADQFNPDAMLQLRSQIDENPNPRLSDKVYGDSLDDIA